MTRPFLQRGRMLAVMFVSALLLVAINASASDRPWEKGPVVQVTSIKIKPGQFNNYMNHLNGTYREIMDAGKAQKLVLDWSIFVTSARSPSDPDMYLTVVYPDLAAMESHDAEWDALSEKFAGDRKKQDQGAMDRESMREILGSELIRELKFKAGTAD